MPRWLIPLLLLLAGALFPLALAPFFWWPLGLVSLAVLMAALQHSHSPRQAFVYTWLFSFAKFAVGVSWIYVSINRFGGTPAPLAVFMVALFAGFLAIFPALVFALRQRLLGQTLAWLTLPVFWFLYEFLRGNFLTGFPWLFAGDAHLHSWLAGWAPIIGSYGISVLLVLSVTLLLEVWQRRCYALLAGLLVWPAGALLQPLEWTHITGSLNVSAVQGNIPQNLKWRPEMMDPTIGIYYDQTSQHWDSDLILWPETAVTKLLDQFRPAMNEIAAEALEHNTTVITGIAYRYPRGHELAGEFHNSIVAFGAGAGIYHKQQLVPFGEFVPFEQQIRGLIPFFDLEMSSFRHGPADQPLLKAAKGEDTFLVAPFICYEIAYPQLVSRMAQQADFLVTVSNDAWFGDSLGPKQHMALAQMRALETGRWLLRATNTGITALVDHKGRLLERLPYEQRGTLSGSAEMRHGSTPYMQLGVWPLAIFSLLILGLAGWRRRRSQSFTELR